MSIFRRALSFVGALMMIAGIFGFSYTWHVDHRTAEHLSAYCRIEFLSSRTETGKLEGAIFSLWDYRYGSEKLLPKAVLYTDGSPWEMIVTVKQTPADEGFKNENKLFAELPTNSLSSIRKAETVRLRFYYDNGDTIDLPLSENDLEYWRRQLTP